MQITAVKCVVVDAEMRNWVFIKIETDQSGHYGWGEVSLEWKTRAVVGAVEDFAVMLVVEDPSRIEHIFQKLYRHSFFRAGVIGMSAISGIEQALWDIKGKFLYQPVYQLLGGRVWDRARMYTHLGGGDMRAVYDTQASKNPSLFAEKSKAVVSQGYTALKVLITPPTEAMHSIAAHKYAVECMEAIRNSFGDDIDIMVDCTGAILPQTVWNFAGCWHLIGRISLRSLCRRRILTPWLKFGEGALSLLRQESGY